MQLKRSMPLSTAVLAASLALGMPAAVIAQQANQQTVTSVRSIAVGHNVVDAVDDVRETTADFIGALLQAEEGLGVANWEQQEARLNEIEKQLVQMEPILDEKAEATDQEWLDWMGGPEWGVTITQQLQSIASYLDEISGILGETWQTEGIQVLVGANVLDQLRDLGETTGDLLNAMENAGTGYGWNFDPNQLQQARTQLQQMKEDIDQPMGMTDDEWRAYLASDQYHVVIHDNVATLSNIIKNLAQPSQG